MTISSARPTVARRLLAAALGLMVSGCSFVSVHRPRGPRAIEDPRVRDDCTTRSAAPIVDTVLAGAGLAVGAILYIDSVGVTAGPDRGSPDLAVAVLGTGAVFTASAIHGHLATGKCRRRVRMGEWCADGDLGACQRLKRGWMPPPEWRGGPPLAPRPTLAPATSPAPPGSPEWTQEPSLPATPPRRASEK